MALDIEAFTEIFDMMFPGERNRPMKDLSDWEVVGELTSKEIKGLDNYTNDKIANKLTLETALQYHSNLSAEIRRQEKQWWADVGERLKIDTAGSIEYRVDKRDGAVVIIGPPQKQPT